MCHITVMFSQKDAAVASDTLLNREKTGKDGKNKHHYYYVKLKDRKG